MYRFQNTAKKEPRSITIDRLHESHWKSLLKIGKKYVEYEKFINDNLYSIFYFYKILLFYIFL